MVVIKHRRNLTHDKKEQSYILTYFLTACSCSAVYEGASDAGEEVEEVEEEVDPVAEGRCRVAEDGPCG